MDPEKQKLQQEEADDQLINDAFQTLLNDYISSRHRKKVDLITKAFNFAKQAHTFMRLLGEVERFGNQVHLLPVTGGDVIIQ